MSEFQTATHTQVRDELLLMQKCGGSMIQPLILYQLFAIFMPKEEITEMAKIRVRDISATFCALCNEYFLIYCRDKNPQTEFYVSEDRWEKYFIEEKAREDSIKFLQERGLIRCVNMEIPNKPINIVRGYSFDLNQLQSYRRSADQLYSMSKAQRHSYLNAFNEAFSRACARALTHA